MEDTRFDDLARMLAAPAPRRRVLRSLIGGLGSVSLALGFGLTRGDEEAAAKRCRGLGKECRGDRQCCSGRCSKQRCRRAVGPPPPQPGQVTCAAGEDHCPSDAIQICNATVGCQCVKTVGGASRCADVGACNRPCTVDADCPDLPGAFCARRSGPFCCSLPSGGVAVGQGFCSLLCPVSVGA